MKVIFAVVKQLKQLQRKPIMSFTSYNGYKLNSHLTCFQQGFIAQLVEHRTGIMELMGSNPVEASDFFLGFLCNCSTTVRSLSILLFFKVAHNFAKLNIIEIGHLFSYPNNIVAASGTLNT